MRLALRLIKSITQFVFLKSLHTDHFNSMVGGDPESPDYKPLFL